MVRFSSQIGFYAISYVEEEKIVKHILIEPVKNENFDGYKLVGDDNLFESIYVLIDYYSQIFIYPYKHGSDLGEIKILIEQLPSMDNHHSEEYSDNFDTANMELNNFIVNIEDSSSSSLLSTSPSSIVIGDSTPQGRIRENTKNKSMQELYEKKINYTSLSNEYQCIAKLSLNDLKYPTRVLYLFNDSISLSYHEFSLWTTWVESINDNYKNGLALRIISPEKKFVILAEDKKSKEIFLELVQKQIIELLKSKNYLREPPDGKKRYAKYSFSHGTYYEGEWENGIFDGLGTYILINGEKYEGEWNKGLKHGKGIEYFINDDKYDGEYKDNLKHGFGIYYYSENNENFLVKYQGQWKEDKKKGIGELHYKGNVIISGEWEENELQINKPISLLFPNGDFYSGYCSKNNNFPPFKICRNGYGIIHYSNGEK